LRNIKQFLINNGLFEVYDLLNSSKNIKWDNTYIKGLKCIEFMAATSSLINFIEKGEIINYNQIIYSDHRGYLIDINLEQYFSMKQFDIDKVNNSQLNSHWLLYKQKFCKKVKEYVQATNLHQLMKEYCNTNASDEILELLDN